MKKLFVVALAVAAGLSVGLGFGAVTQARADAAGRSAYFCFEASDVSDLTVKANAAGQKGWEMVSGAPYRGAGIWCFRQTR